jgi:hypothetical protein
MTSNTAEAWQQQLKLLPLINWRNSCVLLQFLEAPADDGGCKEMLVVCTA